MKCELTGKKECENGYNKGPGPCVVDEMRKAMDVKIVTAENPEVCFYCDQVRRRLTDVSFPRQEFDPQRIAGAE